MEETTQKEKSVEKTVKSVKTEKKSTSTKKLAVILVRSTTKLSQSLKDTLAMLKLMDKKNRCVVVDNNEINLGMIKKVKDYVTWGEIDEKTFNELIEKRGKEFKARLTDSKKKYNYKVLEVKGKKYKTYFSLNPPRKGFGRKGIKLPFKKGGALGNREEKINDLIMRML